MSSGVRTVFLVRHGRTALNAQERLRGLLDVELDDTGRAEAGALARRFAGAALAVVLTSPLTRARQTAAPIAAAAGARVEVDAALTDRDYGSWAGHPAEEVRAQFGSIDGAPGVEPEAELRSRALGALERAAARAEDAPVVVVAHDAVNRTVLAALAPELGAAERIRQHTGCWNHLERRDDGWSVLLVDQLPPRHRD
jgi:broad specificity phosphatase PhoE